MSFVAVCAIGLGVYSRWDNLPESRLSTLDPALLARELLEDETLSAEERGYMKEVAALGLTYRHLIC